MTSFLNAMAYVIGWAFIITFSAAVIVLTLAFMLITVTRCT